MLLNVITLSIEAYLLRYFLTCGLNKLQKEGVTSTEFKAIACNEILAWKLTKLLLICIVCLI